MPTFKFEGEWRVSTSPLYSYKIVEKNHEIKSEYWGYSRHNELYQQKYDITGELIEENKVVKNSAIMMYAPFIEG